MPTSPEDPQHDPSQPPQQGPPPMAREADAAWRAVAYLITGPFTFGGIGWLIDRWAGTGVLVPLGIVGGMALSLYLIWFRYGTH
jgi:F0F1-type ATP synthase assembly protein I